MYIKLFYYIRTSTIIWIQHYIEEATGKILKIAFETIHAVSYYFPIASLTASQARTLIESMSGTSISLSERIRPISVHAETMISASFRTMLRETAIRSRFCFALFDSVF